MTTPLPACGPIAVEISDTQAHLQVDPDALTRLVRRVLDEEGVESRVDLDRAGR